MKNIIKKGISFLLAFVLAAGICIPVGFLNPETVSAAETVGGLENFLVLNVGGTQTISDGSGASYASSDESVAVVSADGTVTAVSTGIADITVTGGTKDESTVKITVVPVRNTTGRVKVALQMYNLMMGGDISKDKGHDATVDALRQIAALGYDGVEFAGQSYNGDYYGIEAKELKEILDKLGLEVASTHTWGTPMTSQEVINDFDRLIQSCKEMGIKKITYAWSAPRALGEGTTNEQWAARLNEDLKIMKERVAAANADIQVVYHNHGDEFMPFSDSDSTNCIDYFKDSADCLETDLYWASNGLQSTEKAVKWANENADKIGLIHIKDGETDGKVYMPWGQGSMPIQNFVDVARANNIEWVVVENDDPKQYNNDNGLQDAAVSAEYFKSNIELGYKSDSPDIILDSRSLTLGVGEKAKLAADKGTVTWKSSNKKAAVVASGTVTAKKKGTAVITAQVGEKTATCTITVKAAPKKITLNSTSEILKKRQNFQIKVRLPKNTASNKITYRSSNSNVVKVNRNGKVTALKKGTAVITVKTFNGKKANVKITVR